MTDLHAMLLENNPYVNMYKQAHEILKDKPQDEQDNVSVRITVDPSTDLRHYNAPTVKEVAAIIPGGGEEQVHLHHDIIVHLLYMVVTSRGSVICTTATPHYTMFCSSPKVTLASISISHHSQVQMVKCTPRKCPSIAIMHIMHFFASLSQIPSFTVGNSFSNIWWMPGHLLRRAICTGSGPIKSRYVLICIKGSMMHFMIIKMVLQLILGSRVSTLFFPLAIQAVHGICISYSRTQWQSVTMGASLTSS